MDNSSNGDVGVGPTDSLDRSKEDNHYYGD